MGKEDGLTLLGLTHFVELTTTLESETWREAVHLRDHQRLVPRV